VDILPVSDPNVFSAQQRIAIAQSLLELATTNPDLYDRREAHRRMLEALKVPAIDDVLLNPEEKKPQDPVTENMLMMAGQGANAIPEQSHEAHLEVHRSFMMHPGFGGHPDVQKIIEPLMMAHMAEHVAYLYQQRMIQSAQGQLPYVPVDVSAGPGDEATPEIEPDLLEELAVRGAMASEQFMQTMGLPPPPPDPAQVAAEQEAQAKQAELAIKQQEAEARMAEKQADIQIKQSELQLKQAAQQVDAQLKQAVAAAEEARKQQAHAAEEARKQQEWQAEERRKEAAHEAEMERKEEAADQQRELAKKASEQRAKEQKAAAKAKPAASGAKK